MDKLTPEQRSANMSQIRSRDSKPEMLVRRLLHSLGYRYALHEKGLPGRPDLVFRRRRKIVFVHGCFWHQHASPTCREGRPPKSNDSYWGLKLKRNVERDSATRYALEDAGWNVLTIWECETRDPEKLKDRLTAFLGPTRARATTGEVVSVGTE